MDGGVVLAIGTALAAGGHALAGFTGSLVGLCAALGLSGGPRCGFDLFAADAEPTAFRRG